VRHSIHHLHGSPISASARRDWRFEPAGPSGSPAASPSESIRRPGNIAKHRIEKYSERATPQKIIDPAKLEVLGRADEIANEWVTPMRLLHVLDKIPPPLGLAQMPAVITAMLEDVLREAKGEIVDSKDARRAIGKRTAELFRAKVTAAVVQP